MSFHLINQHVANGHVNVATGFVSKHLKIGLFWTEQNNWIFLFNSHFKTFREKNGPGCKNCQKLGKIRLYT